MKRTPTQILADATSAMGHNHDVIDALATLVLDCSEALSAGAVGLLVRSDSGRIELLSSTSHAMAELELFQVQQDTGPCIDAISGDRAVSVSGAADICARWPVVGQAIVESGYLSVLASPLRWEGETMGALNSFFVGSASQPQEEIELAQAFADVATLVVMQAAELGVSHVSDRIRSALAGRIIIEQAKGVLAHQQTVDMADAYALLVSTASQNRTSLTFAAEGVVTAAGHRPRPV